MPQSPPLFFSSSVSLLLTLRIVLDDNAYTLRTRSELTGIQSHEMKAMETEFLANLHYSILSSSWEAWIEEFKYLSEIMTAPLQPGRSNGSRRCAWLPRPQP